jgi:ADP-ribosyl-[dinitrogen reductase] hydrolase
MTPQFSDTQLNRLMCGDLNGGPTRMAGILSDSLETMKGFDPDHVRKMYLDWWREDAFDTGPTFAITMGELDRDTDPEEAVRIAHEKLGGNSGGCGPVHRAAAPLALCRHIPTSQLAEAAIREARLTHFDPVAGDFAAAVALLIRCSIDETGGGWIAALKQAGRGRLSVTQAALEGGTNQPAKPNGYAPDALQAAIYFLQSSTSLEEALERSIRFAGPENYCPVMVGAIGAAREYSENCCHKLGQDRYSAACH